MSTPSVTILKNLVLNWESNQMEEETTWRKRGTDLPGFPTFRQAPGQSRNPPPIEMLKTPSSRETIGRRRVNAGHAAAAR